MNRNSQHSAIILRVVPFGEIHAGAEVVTPDEGVLHVTAYGARSRRGTLRGKIVPFAQGEISLYTDPRRDFKKVVEFDVQRYTLSVQQNLHAYYHASLWVEVVWRTHAAGERGGEVYTLLAEGLSLLDSIVADRGNTASMQLLSAILLWRYLGKLGVRPDPWICAASERAIAAEAPRFYDRREGVVVGTGRSDASTISIPSGTARLLRASARYPLQDAAALPVTPETLRATRRFVFAAIQDAVETPLNTIEVAGDAL